VRSYRVSPCPNCSGSNLYRTRKPVSSGGGHAPNYLPGLGRLLLSGRFDLVVCRDCGLTRFFATRESTEKLGDASRWERV
jgi:DNA-directed RNA polymerase subunit RPC12/RpoP